MSTKGGSKMELGNIGLAIQTDIYTAYGRKRKKAESGLKSYTIAFGYNQIENYHNSSTVSAYNPHSSITDRFAEMADGILDTLLDANFPAGLAWNNYAIDWIGPNNEQKYFGAARGGEIQQTSRLEEDGKHGEWYISTGLNIDDKFYVGGNLSIHTLKYNSTRIFEEEDVNNLHQNYQPNRGDTLTFPFNALEYREVVATTGFGLHGSLGMIYKINDALRLGLNFTSPTSLLFTDRFHYELSHSHNLNIDSFTVQRTEVTNASTGDPLESEYNVKTPFKTSAGLTYMFEKKGFVNIEAEMIDYSGITMKSGLIESDAGFYDYATENEAIKSQFQSAVNLKVGGEFRQNILRIRAGAALYGSPLALSTRLYDDVENPGNALTFKPSRKMLTIGLGIKQPNYSIDVAYINHSAREKSSPYTTDEPTIFDPVIISTRQSHRVVFSVGFRL